MAFQINFTHTNPITSQTDATDIAYGNPVAYGHGTFLVYWMLNFWGMVALGLACENVSMIVGQPWTALWLIFWVITNVSTAFYDIGIEPRFYYWGYAWPLHSGKSIRARPPEPVLTPMTQWSKEVVRFCSTCIQELASTLES